MVTRMAGESGPCSAWVMRSRADPERIRGRGGEDEALRRAGRQVDADLAADLDLGRRDPGVARADDPVDRLDAGIRQAVGEGADGLGAAGHDERVDAEQAGRPEQDRMDPAVAIGRRGHDDPPDTGDPGRHDGHDQRARVRRRATGHVRADAVERRPAALELDALGDADRGTTTGAGARRRR